MALLPLQGLLPLLRLLLLERLLLPPLSMLLLLLLLLFVALQRLQVDLVIIPPRAADSSGGPFTAGPCASPCTADPPATTQ